MDECNCEHLTQFKKVIVEQKMMNVWYFASLVGLLIALLIFWIAGAWNGSKATFNSYLNNYYWATPGVLGLFSSFAVILLWFATMAVGWNNSPSIYRTINMAQYFLYYFQLLLYVIAAIVLFRVSTSKGALASFSLTLVGLIVGVIQLVLQCFVIANGEVGNGGVRWLRVVLPMLLYLTWVIIFLAVTYHMWKEGM